MKKYQACAVIAVALSVWSCSGQPGKGSIQAQNQKILEENERRLISLEQSINALNSQVAQLNNRVYEVRNRNGQKTTMTVVPITPAAPKTTPAQESRPVPILKPGDTAENARQAAAAPVETAKPAPAPVAATPATAQTPSVKPALRQTPPTGKKIDPAAAPAPLRASAAPVQTQARNTPASGRVGANPAAAPLASNELGLPPMDLPVPEAVAPTPATNAPAVNNNVPVPNIYAAEVGLPPETDVSNIAVPQAVSTPPAQPRQAASAKGEEAAYNAALRAARSGRINEALTLFRKFEQDYPNGRYKANADYWIGECLYSQGKLQDALAQFQNVNTVYPTHHKNADALLKAGMTLSRLGNQAAAQEKYRTLINTFPNTEAARRARAMGIR